MNLKISKQITNKYKIQIIHFLNKKCLKPIIVVNNVIKEASQNFLKLDPYKILKSKNLNDNFRVVYKQTLGMIKTFPFRIKIIIYNKLLKKLKI